LLTITRNAAIDATRYRHEEPMDPEVLVAVLAGREQDGAVDDPATSLRLRQALADLPPEQARPIVLMTFYGLTAKEIAARSDVPVGTVKTRVRRGLRSLRGRWGVRDG
jgi:RNA polymerase sigma-70 factor (ECF subfamily)